MDKLVKKEIVTKAIRTGDGREFELHQEIEGGVVVGFQTRDTGIHLMLWDGKEGWFRHIGEID